MAHYEKDSARAQLDDYIDMTNQLDRVFKYYEYEEGTYPICEDCDDIDNCYLIERIHKRGKLYHQLPMDIAARIDDYCKNAIELS